MPASPLRRANWFTCVAAALAAAGLASSASAVVVMSPAPFTGPASAGKPREIKQDQMPLVVGTWNNASAVAVAPDWVLTARHVQGSAGGEFSLGGKTYIADRLVPNHTGDLLLVHLQSQVENWVPVSAAPVSAGERVLLAGSGFVAGRPVSEGMQWSDSRGVAWGANRVEAAGASLMIRFDDPASSEAVSNEAMFTLWDSGGGLFREDVSGRLSLVGIASMLGSSYGLARFGDMATSVALADWAWWVQAIAEPGLPVASSVPAPPAGSWRPPRVPTPGVAATLVIGAVVVAGSRRRAA